MSTLDKELEDARQRAAAPVLVLWKSRSGGLVAGGTVRVLWPGAAEPVEVGDGELAALRSMELGGRLQVTWPWIVALHHAPKPLLDDRIELAARALLSL